MKIKNWLCIVAFVAAAILLTCALVHFFLPAKNTSTKEHKTEVTQESTRFASEHVDRNITIIVDKKTGVNYEVYERMPAGGIGMTPLYNSDGSLVISK